MVVDLYYVPRFSDPHTFMTVDPAVVFDWENEKQFATLAVTLGRVLGKALGGNSQVYGKPSIQVGTDRSADWGFEAGSKLIF
jgi:hypothetical protein